MASTSTPRERYAPVSNKIISSIISETSFFNSKENAFLRLEKLRSMFTCRRIESDEQPRVEFEILWISGFRVVDSEKKKGFMGHYARIEIEEKDGRFFLIAKKLNIELKYHPRRRRPSGNKMPNPGHPLIRRLRKKNWYYFNSRQEAINEMMKLHEEFEQTTILVGFEKLHLMIFSRKDDPKNPVTRWTIRLAQDNDDRWFLSISRNNFDAPIIEKNESTLIKTDYVDDEFVRIRSIIFPEDRSNIVDAITKYFIEAIRTFDYRRTAKFPSINADREILYHFTDLKTLKAMLDSKQLWISHLRFMNDTREVLSGVDTIVDKLTEITYAYHGKNPDVTKTLSGIFDELDSLKDMGVYGMSFTESEQASNQWQVYGDNGKGLAIGFCSSSLFASQVGIFSNIKYFGDRKREVLELFFKNIVTNKNELINSNSSEEVSRCIGLVLRLMAALFKNVSYSAEREWRLVMLENKTRNRELRVKEVPQNNGGIIEVKIPYYKIPVNDVLHGGVEEGITHVVLGPGTGEAEKRFVESLKLEYGLSNLEILESQVPLTSA